MNSLPAQKNNSLLNSIIWSGKSDVGMRREENQDALCTLEKPYFKFFAVADGMGGAKGGAIASQLTAKVVSEELSKHDRPSYLNLVDAIHQANEAVYREGRKDLQYSGMGTTLVGLLFDDSQVMAVNVGDSRAYLVRDSIALQLTNDHTLISELIKSGAITEEQSANHPVSHMLTRSIGPTEEIQVDYFKIDHAPLPGDKYLLCSDGLYNHVQPLEIAEILTKYSAEQASEALIKLANQRGGSDNISVIVITVSSDADISTLDLDTKDMLDPQILSDNKDQINTIETIEDNFNQNIDLANQVEASFTSNIVNEFREALPTEADASFMRSLTWSFKDYKKIIGILLLVSLAAIWRFSINSNESDTLTNEHKSEDLVNNNIKIESQKSIEEKPPKDSFNKDKPKDNTSYSSFEMARNRVEELEKLISELEVKVSAFDLPLSGKVADLLADTTRKIDNIKRQITTIDSDLYTANKTAAILFGQEQRLKSMEILKVASEISKLSPEILEVKKSFENITWRYLKERDKSENDPYNKELLIQVEQLAQQRRQELEKLARVLNVAIATELKNVTEKQSELTIQKDLLEKELRKSQRELSYVHALMSQEPEKRNAMRESLTQELSRARTEFTTLQNMITSSLSGTDLQLPQ
jgi:serine/threonine protein phosphatase PrpC